MRGYYKQSPKDDPTGPRGAASARVIRGGSWCNGAAHGLPVGIFVAGVGRTSHIGDLGFRVARASVRGCGGRLRWPEHEHH